MRFVVPVPSIYTRPNRKYFGNKRGLTWLNMINDQGVGLGAKVVTGTVRDSLRMIDVLFRRDGGPRPEVIVTDTGCYSDAVFGLVHLLGMQSRPALVDLPDQMGWRIQGRRLRAADPVRPRQDRPGQGAAAHRRPTDPLRCRAPLGDRAARQIYLTKVAVVPGGELSSSGDRVVSAHRASESSRAPDRSTS
ncbi:Tn3 family transposase [Nonomuraea muscovyensis]|nr:Tn3 family transposase [Nonomuraea muscovyensis]